MNKVKSKIIRLFLISFLILGTIYPLISFAENQISIQDGEISVETSPNNPGPYQDVTINLSSYATDLNKAIITWQTKAGTVLSGIGKTSYTFKTEGTETLTTINIIIQPSGSVNTITKRISIIPTEIEIMWESMSGYTPPFYKGKTLPVSGSLIKAVAIPNTKTIGAGSGSITYTWKNSGETNLEASGYNKNSYVFKNSLFEEQSEITVISSAVAGNFGAEKTIIIPTYDPKLIFYKKSPTEGTLYNMALEKEATLIEDEMTIVAEPYFTSFSGKENNFIFNWKINGENIQTPSKKTELTIRPNSRGGYATIGLAIENTKELFQKISNSLKLNI